MYSQRFKALYTCSYVVLTVDIIYSSLPAIIIRPLFNVPAYDIFPNSYKSGPYFQNDLKKYFSAVKKWSFGLNLSLFADEWHVLKMWSQYIISNESRFVYHLCSPISNNYDFIIINISTRLYIDFISYTAISIDWV